MQFFKNVDEIEAFDAPVPAAPASLAPGLYAHQSGTKHYLVSADTDVVIVLADGRAPRASNRWDAKSMATAPAGYFTQESEEFVLAN